MSENIKLFVKTLVGAPVKLIMKETDSVYNLKEKILSLTGIPLKEQIVIFSDILRTDSKLLKSFLTRNGNTCLVLTEKESPKCIIFKEINIKIEYEEINSILKIIINNWTTVYGLKEMINQGEKIPLEYQNILYNDNILEDEKTLYYYGIKEDSILNLKKVKNIKKIKIYIKNEDQTNYNAYLVSPYEKINCLKDKILKSENIKIFDWLNIYYLDKSMKTGEISESTLLDQDNLYDKFINEEDQLIYEVFNLGENSNDIRIKINNNNRSVNSIYVKKSDRIISIKEKYLGIPESFRCVFKGNLLENNKRIQDYNILNDDTINIIPHFLGY